MFVYLHEVKANCTTFSTACISRDPFISVSVHNRAVTPRGEHRFGTSEGLSISTDAQTRSISVSVHNAAVSGRGENRIGPSEGLSTSTDAQEILAGRETEATFQVCKKLEEIAGEVGLLALSNE